MVNLHKTPWLPKVWQNLINLQYIASFVVICNLRGISIYREYAKYKLGNLETQHAHKYGNAIWKFDGKKLFLQVVEFPKNFIS